VAAGAALAGLEAERAAAEAEQAAKEASRLADAAAGTPRPGPPPAGAAVELARLGLERARAQRAAQLAGLEQRYAAGQPRRGRAAGVDDYCRVRQAQDRLSRAQARAAAAAGGQDNGSGKGKGKGKGGNREPVRNITDPDSRLMPLRGGGFLQGYNPQNVTCQDGLIIATELTADPSDCGWFEPMLRRAEDAAALITAHRPPPPGPAPGQPASKGGSLIGLLLSDAGYLSEHNLTIDGPDRLIATGKTRDLEQAARDGTTATRASEHITAMAARLATTDGITAYRQRSHIAETPHGHIKHNMRFRQLSMRGKPKAAAEWTFTCTTHNLLKAITTGHLTTTALDSLTTQPAPAPTRPA
jgi:DDE family transposase